MLEIEMLHRALMVPLATVSRQYQVKVKYYNLFTYYVYIGLAWRSDFIVKKKAQDLMNGTGNKTVKMYKNTRVVWYGTVPYGIATRAVWAEFQGYSFLRAVYKRLWYLSVALSIAIS